VHLSAEALIAWLASDPTGVATTNIVVMGDLNAYERETPITTLTAAGFKDVTNDYSYLFDGQFGSLGYMLVKTGGAVAGMLTLVPLPPSPAARMLNVRTVRLAASLTPCGIAFFPSSFSRWSQLPFPPPHLSPPMVLSQWRRPPGTSTPTSQTSSTTTWS
jgi:hypothetical protein